MNIEKGAARADEERRLLRLSELGILDTAPESIYDDIVKAASLACGIPISLISLVDRDRQWFKANIGLPGVTETPREVAFCSHAIESDEPLEIVDAARDSRFASNPLVVGAPNIRFYAGFPLRLSDGNRVGTLCVIDDQPRKLTQNQRDLLQCLAISAAKIMEAERMNHDMRESEARFRALCEFSPVGIFRTDPEGFCTYTSPTWNEIFGLAPSESLGDAWATSIHPEDRANIFECWKHAALSKVDFKHEFRLMRTPSDIRYVSVQARPILNSAFEVSGHIGVVEDITNRKILAADIQLERDRLRSLVDGTRVGTWEWNVQTGEVRINDLWATMIGYSLEELAPFSIDTWIKLTHPDDYDRATLLLERHFAGEIDYYDCDIRMRHKKGHWIWVHDRGRVATSGGDGQPQWVMGTHTDITARIENARKLREGKEALERTGKIARVGGWSIDLETNEVLWSEQACRILTIDPGTHRNLDDALKMCPGESFATIVAALEKAKKDGSPWDCEVQMRAGDGRLIWAKVTGEVQYENERPVQIVGVVKDITRRYAAEQALNESRELLQVTLESIGDAVITTDVDGVVTWLNPVAEKLTGWSRSDGCGQAIEDIFKIVHEGTREPIANPMLNSLADGAVMTLADHAVLIARDGAEHSIADSAAPIRDRHGHLIGAVMVFHDVTEQRMLNKTIEHRATHDKLTGLTNREEFEHRPLRVFQNAKEYQSRSALMYIDLDEFKIVNDTCGHSVGDELLKQVADLLRQCVRRRDTLARLGGDEFGVLLEHCSVDQAERVANSICETMDNFRFVHNNNRFRIGASIGLISVDEEAPSNAALLQAADAACYAAKEAGRNRVYISRNNDQNTANRRGETLWATRIERALDEDRFVLFGQTINPLSTNVDRLHCEVLLRMKGIDGSVIPPGAFLPAAERYHLASRVDRWVVRKVFELMRHEASWQEKIGMIAINLSGQSIGDSEFHQFMMNALQSAQFDVRKLCLEITETAVINRINDAKVFIQQVRALGVRVALDDFGAGASSFSYLKALPVDYLKIDGRFIKNILTDQLDLTAVRCFIEVAQVMGIETVAEFVESDSILKMIQSMGVNYGQGYYFQRPAPIEHVINSFRPGESSVAIKTNLASLSAA